MVGGHHNTRNCVEGSQRLRTTALGSSMETVGAAMHLVPFSHHGLTEEQMLDAFEDAHTTRHTWYRKKQTSLKCHFKKS